VRISWGGARNSSLFFSLFCTFFRYFSHFFAFFTFFAFFRFKFCFASIFSLNFHLFYLRFRFRFLVFRIEVNHVKSGFFFASKRNEIFASISNFASEAKVRAHPTWESINRSVLSGTFEIITWAVQHTLAWGGGGCGTGKSLSRGLI
jgi:hypothetical protein